MSGGTQLSEALAIRVTAFLASELRRDLPVSLSDRQAIDVGLTVFKFLDSTYDGTPEQAVDGRKYKNMLKRLDGILLP